MSTFSDLSQDREFVERWPYIWSKLQPHLLKMQRDYAATHRGQHDKVGMFVEFIADLMNDFESIDATIQNPTAIRRKRLNNKEFQQ